MTARGTRGVGALAALLAAAAFAAGPAFGVTGGADATAKPHPLDTARLGPARTVVGIVQAVRPHAVVVRQLDGQRVRVPVGPRTVVIVMGARSTLDAVKAGFVVTLDIRPSGVAAKLRAHDPSGRTPGPTSKPNTVQSVSADSVVVADWHGGTATVAVGRRTRIFLNGSPAAVSDIQAGDSLVNAAGKAAGPQPPAVLRFKRAS